MGEPAIKQSQPFDLDEFERRLRGDASGQVSGRASGPAPVDDPLAELARLVEGNRAPFATNFQDARAPKARIARPVEVPRPAAQQDFHDDTPAADRAGWQLRGSGYPAAQVEPAHGDYAGGYGARDLDAGQPADWAPQAHSWADEPEAAEPPPRRSRLALYGMAAALSLVVVGIGTTVMTRGGRTLSNETPTIKAASGPLKVVPEASTDSADSARSATVLDRAGDRLGTSRVVTNEEQPVELSQMRSQPPANPNNAATVQTSPVRTAAPAAPTSAFPEPIRVKTVSVRPDGTIISNDQGAANAMAMLGGSAMQQPVPPQRPQVNPGMPTGSTPAVARPASPKSTARAVTTPMAAPSTSEAIEAMPAAPRAAQPRSPVVTAAAEPTRITPAPTAAATAGGAGGFAVQLAAAGSDAEARDKAGKFQQQFASAIGGHRAGIVQGEVNGKSVWRIRVGGLTREAAVTMCTQIKGSGGACFVAAN